MIDAPSTNFVAGPDKTVTAVRRDGSIEILEPRTIYNTVGRTTIELPTAYETVYTTDVDYIGTTSVDTVYDVVGTQTTLEITDTTEITTATSTDVVTETVTTIESIPTTSTEYVVTGTTIKFAPGMTIHVTNSRTFVVYSVPSTRTHVLYTSTDYLTSAWTTVTVGSTDTAYTTVPTETIDVTTATNTVDETITTSTETSFAESTVTTNEWTTETCESFRLTPSTYTNFLQLSLLHFLPRLFPPSTLSTSFLGTRTRSVPLRPLLSKLAEASKTNGLMSLANLIYRALVLVSFMKVSLHEPSTSLQISKQLLKSLPRLTRSMVRPSH